MMKKLLLLGLAFSAGVGVTNAQNARLRLTNLQKASDATQLAGDAFFSGTRTTSAASQNNKSMTAGSFGTQIGHSYYDLPSNSSMANRIIRHSDGTISAVWNETCATGGSPSFPTRGAGYNYFNGTTWIHGATSTANEFVGTCNETGANFGIASKRIGWPEIISLPSGNEMVFGHDVGITVTSRPAKGTGGMAAWSATTDLTFTQNVQGVGNNGTWPRVISSGNNIHMIYTLNKTVPTGSPVEPVINGVSNPIVYSRSTDGGVTWNIQNMFLPEMDAAHGYTRGGADAYSISVNGNHVAITSGAFFSGPMTVWRSSDNGTTWTRTVIDRITAADTLITATDTIGFGNDGAFASLIEPNGTVHVWAGEIAGKVSFKNNEFVAGTSWFPSVGRALLYWNSTFPANTPPQVIATIENSQTVGGPNDWVASNTAKLAPYGTMGLVSMANAAMGNGRMYVVYAAAVKATSNNGGPTGQPFRDLYVVQRSFNGNWEAPINISRSMNLFPTAPGSSAAENFEESVFPSVAHEVGADNKLHITWMTDFEPGMNLGADADPEGENAFMYLALNVASLGTKKDMAAYVNEINAYPNPTNGKLTINVDLKKNANVSVRVMNVMGQEVANVTPRMFTAGNNNVAVDMSGLANGVYLYTVTSDNFTVTNRIVKQ
jgi:hypothetical protein